MLARSERSLELTKALPRYLAVDWGRTIWGPAQLLPGLSESAADSASRHELAQVCVQWFETRSGTVDLDWAYKSQRFASCLYMAGEYNRAEALLRQLVDTMDRQATSRNDTTLGPPARDLVVARANRIAAWSLLGKTLALRGKPAEAERVLELLATLPAPSPLLPGYYYEFAASIAAALGHRELAIDLALRARQNRARAGRSILSRLDPVIARYRRDTTVLAAFGITHRP